MVEIEIPDENREEKSVSYLINYNKCASYKTIE